jgi:hypothetical protein
MDKICCVFTCNHVFLDKFKNTCEQLINNGKYTGDITLIIGDDMELENTKNDNFIKDNNINVIKFDNIKFSDDVNNILESVNDDGRCREKKFQWHKIHLFDIYFKNWDYVLYLDSGLSINHDISPIIESRKKDKLLAQSDAYPTMLWRLRDQFDQTKELFNKLNNEYDLDIDYFQSTIMLYDTNIINDKLVINLLELTNRYPITRTNEQGIMALYFTNIDKKWDRFPLSNERFLYYSYHKGNNQNLIINKIL